MKFYYNSGPNPMKVALLLEELGLPYEAIPVDGARGEQFLPDYLAINPNGKMPAIVDGETILFDSNAILLHLAQKHGRFLSDDTDQARGMLLSWLMFVATGVGPFSGQAVHFRHFAPEPKDYAVNRYAFEARRHYGILDSRLSDREWMVGSSYSIVDMAVWGWARLIPFVLGEDALAALPALKRLLDTVEARPAARGALEFLARHAFKEERDAEFRRNMFRHLREGS
jgi:GST-like protein